MLVSKQRERITRGKAHDSALEEWKAGTLGDAALWHKCFLILWRPLIPRDLKPAIDGLPQRSVSVLACSLIKFRFRLTFEIDQSTYAGLEHVTEWGPRVVFLNT